MPTASTLALVPPDQWRKRTALTLSSRGTDTKKVDAAYDKYFQSKAPEEGKILFLALEEYVRSHGGNWERAKRDKASGGLMRYMHEYTRQFAPPQLIRSGDKLHAGRAALASLDIPHSRYGVLYLLGNLDVEYDTFKIVTEGISVVGGPVAHEFGDGYDMSMEGTVAGHKLKVPIKSNDYITGGTAIVKAVPKIKSALGGPSAHKTKTGGEQDSASLAPRVSRTQASHDGWPLTNQALWSNNYSNSVTHTLGIVGAWAGDVYYTLKASVTNAIYKLVDFIHSKIAFNKTSIYKAGGMALRKLVDLVVHKVLAQAVPVLDVVKDVSGGILKTFDAAKVSLGAYMERRQISLNPGHPESTANTIEHAMRMGMGAGMIDLLKGVAKTAVHTFLPGLSVLVNAIMTGVEYIVKWLMRKLELKRIESFLKEARVLYQDEKRRALAKSGYTETTYAEATKNRPQSLTPETDPARGGIIVDMPRFRDFFQSGCDASPLVPMLTLNSGICGSLMVMLAMFKDSQQAEMIEQKTWDTGSQYFGRLKSYSREYLRNAGFDFTSTDHFVRQSLLHATNHHVTAPSGYDKGRAFVGGLLGA